MLRTTIYSNKSRLKTNQQKGMVTTMGKNKEFEDWCENEFDEWAEAIRDVAEEIQAMDVKIIPERAAKLERDLEDFKEVVTGNNITFNAEFGKPFKDDASISIEGDNLVITNPREFTNITDRIFGAIDFYRGRDGGVVIGATYRGVYEVSNKQYEDIYLETEEEILVDRIRNAPLGQNKNAENRLINTFDLLKIRMMEAGLEDEIPAEIFTLTLTMDEMLENLLGDFDSEIDVVIKDDNHIGFIIREFDLTINDIVVSFETMANASEEIRIRAIPNDEEERVETEFVVRF